MNKLVALASQCDAKTVDYVTEAVREAVADQQQENAKLLERISSKG